MYPSSHIRISRFLTVPRHTIFKLEDESEILCPLNYYFFLHRKKNTDYYIFYNIYIPYPF